MNFHIPGPENENDGVHLAPHTHHFQNAQSPPSVHFKHPGAQPIDPRLGTGGTGGSTGPPGNPISASPHLTPHESVIHSGLYADTPRSSAPTPSTPSIHSPSLSRQSLPSFTPVDRSLPSRDVSEDSIDETYAAFILYCNPIFPLSTDTTELKKIFRQPPKSDGKSFSIWHLFELVKRYEEKEIKTWVELALELGVEKPALDKGQSTQKVQQYSVRLKRWMRAMHVDSFFDFLRGSPKEYYTHIPPPHDYNPDGGREGVPAEEDLAIRALDPSMRPKRGRRKADDIEDEADRAVTPEPKRTHLDGSIDFTSPSNFAAPPSAYPDEFAHPDPWAAASAVTPASFHPGKGLTPSSAHPSNLFRWRVNGTMDTPITPHPLSAVTPASAMTAHPDSAWGEEPQSAMTMTPRGKSRRRHGPLVSSAWSSSASTQNGKLRGRPPSNRTVRDGPFSTFPANPKAKDATPIEMGKTPISTLAPPFPPPPLTIPQNIPRPAAGTESPVPQSAQSTQSHKRERLQLMVPQRIGGPVHLITPPTTGAGAPPTVLVNGEAERGAVAVPQAMDSPPPPRGSVFFSADSSGDEQQLQQPSNPPSYHLPPHHHQRHSSSSIGDFDQQQAIAGAPMAHMTPPISLRQPSLPVQKTTLQPHPASPFSPEDLKRALAHELLRATLSGRKRKRLRGHEAKGLAAAMLARIENPSVMQAATWLGLANELAGISEGKVQGGGKKIVCHRFRVDDDGYDSPMEDDDADEGPSEEADERKIKETWDVSWSLLLGGLSGDFSLKGLVIAAAGDEGGGGGKDPSGHGDGFEGADGEDWRDKFVRAKEELRAKEEEVRKLRDKVLDAVL